MPSSDPMYRELLAAKGRHAEDPSAVAALHYIFDLAGSSTNRPYVVE
jgi:hypothetical protein